MGLREAGVSSTVGESHDGKHWVTILYKYVSAERALTCIPEVGDGALRATQPASLNDPFECAVTTPYAMDEPRANRELAKALTEINPNSPVTEDDVRRARREHGSLFVRQLLAEQASTRFGIVSFSPYPYHPLMWSHYTVDGSGFAIGYDSPVMVLKVGGSLRAMRYGKEPVALGAQVVLDSPESTLRDLLSIKGDHWSYEQEWRLIVDLSSTIGTGAFDHHGQPFNLVQVPNETVVRVYYTERTPRDAVDLIRDRLAAKNNRYRTEGPRKLILSTTSYGYEETPS